MTLYAGNNTEIQNRIENLVSNWVKPMNVLFEDCPLNIPDTVPVITEKEVTTKKGGKIITLTLSGSAFALDRHQTVIDTRGFVYTHETVYFVDQYGELRRINKKCYCEDKLVSFEISVYQNGEISNSDGDPAIVGMYFSDFSVKDKTFYRVYKHGDSEQSEVEFVRDCTRLRLDKIFEDEARAT